MLWLLTILLSGLVILTGCSSGEEDSSTTHSDEYEILGLTRKIGKQDNKGIVVKLFERNGMKLQVVDITDQFESATFKENMQIPVSHVYLEQLPSTIQELAVNAGESMSTRICRIEYEGEYYYDIYGMYLSTWVNIYNSNGERHDFNSTEEYQAFMSKATNICCILVLATEVVKMEYLSTGLT